MVKKRLNQVEVLGIFSYPKKLRLLTIKILSRKMQASAYTATKAISKKPQSSVYKVQHDHGTIFALKKIKKIIIGANAPLERKYIGAEIYIMSQLDNPNVLRLRDHWISGSSYNIITDFYDCDLSEKIAGWDTLPIGQREDECVF